VTRRLRASPEVPSGLRAGFARIRAEAAVPDAFPPEVLADAERLAMEGPAPADRRDLTEVAFVTVDPPGSRDLDQAMHLARDGDGHRILYAIADVGAWVPRGGPVEREAWNRGATVYSPDGRTPLYPPVLSEAAASLLPEGPRPAVVFTLDVAADGEVTGARVERALVRSRARLAYEDVGPDTLPLLDDVGDALAAASARRGASRIDLPEQEVEPAATPEGFALTLRARLPAEDWNAEVSLAANVAAARMMARAGAGLFRVMAEPDPERTEALRAAAVALGFSVPPLEGLRALAATRGPVPALTAFRRAARRVGGVGYRALGPADPPPWHAAVAAPYAHATAPLRRLADRYVLDLLLTTAAGGAPTGEERATLEALVPVMSRAESVADRVEAAAIDLVEATLLHRREGAVFDAVVLSVDGSRARIQLREPPVRGSVPEPAGLVPGDDVRVRLVRADPGARAVGFQRAEGTAGGNGRGAG